MALSTLSTLYGLISAQPISKRICTRKIKPMRAAYLRHVGPYKDTKQTWFDLMARLSADKQIRKRSVFIGIGQDNPS